MTLHWIPKGNYKKVFAKKNSILAEKNLKNFSLLLNPKRYDEGPLRGKSKV
jgi:hypothetical protein